MLTAFYFLLSTSCLYAKMNLGIISAVKNKVKQLKEKIPVVRYDEKTGTVTIPNSTIITGGQQYSETAPISDTGLALVITSDSSLYFYSPKSGDLHSLTAESSCQAIGYFLDANLGKETSYSQPRDVMRAIDTKLKTGVALKTISSTTIECSNTLHRWAAIKVSPTAEKELLPPREFFKIDIISIFQGDWGNIFQFNTTPKSTVEIGDKIETYGAIAKLFLAPGNTWIKLEQFNSVADGFNSDKTVFACLQILDGLDLIFLITDAIYPLGTSSLKESVGEALFKTTVKAGVEDGLGEIIAKGYSEKNARELGNTVILTYMIY